MKVELGAGKYVLAVSGGVDSVVLLDVLSKLPNVELVVAHYDHGIRADSALDQQLVERLAKQYKLKFFAKAGKLGSKTSEALARDKRYEFLRSIKEQVGAEAIVTAHHQDDVIETAVLNQLRGTGRRGLSSLKNTDEIIRPLLTVPKQDLIAYAVEHNLQWREDSTNADERYLRNYVRHQITPKLSKQARAQLLANLQKAAEQNKIIDELLQEATRQHTTANELDRQWFISLPHSVAKEVLLAWLRQEDIRQLDRKQVEKLVTLAKTLPRGKLIDVDAGFQLKVTTDKLALVPRER